MATVPDTNTFSLQDVRDVINPGGIDRLTQCFAQAVDACFDPTYKGSKDRLSNFRNYGWQGVLTQENVYEETSADYIDVCVGTGALAGHVFCITTGTTWGLLNYVISGVTLLYQDNDHDGSYEYTSVCQGDGLIFVAAGDGGIKSYSVDGGTNELVLEDEVNDPGIYMGVWYQEGTNKLWAVGSLGVNALIRVYNVDSGGNMTLYKTKNDIDTVYYDITGDGGYYVYVACHFDGLKSFWIDFSGALVMVDSDNQGDAYFDVFFDPKGYGWAFTAIGTTVGPRSHTAEFGSIDYKDEDDRDVNAIGICGMEHNMIFVATGADGLLCYKVNLTTGVLTFMDVDDQGGVYYKCDSNSSCVYVATSSGIRVYSFI